MKSVKLLGMVGMLASLCWSTQAVMLPPGSVGLDAPQAPGSDILATLVTPYSFGGLSGTVTSWVVSDPANPLGGLSFYYQVNNTGTESVGRFTASDFGIIPAAPVEVSTIAGPFSSSVTGGVLPTFGTRSPGVGSVVGFEFLNVELPPGQASAVMVINTAYQAFQITAGSVIDSSSANVLILGPVPEPSTVIAGCLLLLPLGASALRIVRKQ